MNKKIVMSGLALTVMLSATACSTNEEKPETPETTVAPEVENTDAPATNPDEYVDVDQDPEVLPDATVETFPTDEKVTAVIEKIASELGNDMLANMPIPPEIFTEVYGLDPETFETAEGLMPMISANIDLIVGVKAKDVKAVETAFNAYATAQKEDALQYPMNAAAVNALKVVTTGDYVWLVGTYGDFSQVMTEDDDSDAAITEYANKTVQKTVDIINAEMAN